MLLSKEDIEIILAMFEGQELLLKQKNAMKKLQLMKEQMECNETFQSRMLEIRKEFEDLIKE